jgi:DNA-binding response OmpR family regulator
MTYSKPAWVKNVKPASASYLASANTACSRVTIRAAKFGDLKGLVSKKTKQTEVNMIPRIIAARTPLRSFRFDDVEVDFEKAEVRKNGQPLNLAGKELQLLQYLVERRGLVVPREEIMQEVWAYSREVTSTTIDVHVAWLRQKIEENPQYPKHIHTVRGKGYRFTV